MNNPTPDGTPPSEDPKIIVDEDWKSQVEAEKEATQPQDETPSPEPGSSEIPDASFTMLVTTLATQAAVALGQSVVPDATEVHVDLGLAKHIIDTLDVLNEKTKGNLTPEESGMLTSVLHQLRMLFVAIRDQAKEPPEEKSSSIELP